MLQTVSKYWNSFLFSITLQLSHKAQLVGRIVMYLFIIYLFSQVIGTVDAGPQRLWYIAVTELIILSVSGLSFQIADDINSGNFEYYLLRPVNYLTHIFFEGLGATLVRFCVLGISGMFLLLALTHYWPGYYAIFIGCLFSFFSICLYLLITILIGISSYWLKDIKQLFYLNLTSSFCFGGLIVPLTFYSTIMKKISFCTPYPWILWAPAQIISGENISILPAAFSVAIWFAVILWVLNTVYKKFLQSFLVQGL